jgi:hypothetical protein
MTRTFLRKTLVLFITWFVFISFPCMAQSPTETAGSLGNQAIEKYGSKEGLNSNLFNPLMSGSVPLTTLDGSNQGNAQLSCPSSQRFMEILLQPGPSGDIATLMVSQDTDFDGILDYSYQAPFLVSGVCTNGVIACDSGKWTNCSTYSWVSDASGRASFQPASENDMKGCFCVNSSCGNGLVLRNVDVILKAMGGGVVGAIHRNNTRYVISDVKIDGAYAQYFGQDSTRCSAAVGAASPEQYFYNPGALQGAIDAAVAGQSGDPDSMYSIQSNAGATVQAEVKSCTVTRAARIVWDSNGACGVEEAIQDSCGLIEEDPACGLRDETVDSVGTFRHYNSTGLVPTPSCTSLNDTKTANCAYKCPGAGNYTVPCMLDDGVPRCTVGGTKMDCVISNPIAWAGGNWEIDSDEHDSYVRLYGSGNEIVVYAWDFDGNAEGAVARIVLSSGTAVGSTPYFPGSFSMTAVGGNTIVFGNGSLITVEGVSLTGSLSCVSYMGAFVRTGNNVGCTHGSGAIGFSNACPLSGGTTCTPETPDCFKVCSKQVCNDWWRKERTYTCVTSGYDFTDARKRVQAIRNSVQDQQTAFYYRDYRKTDSGWQYEDNTYDMSGVYRPTVESCEKACKTKKLVDDTETTVLTKKDDFTAPSTYAFFYKKCTEAGCPVSGSEVIVKDCQCINEFAEAAIIMQSLRQAGRDLICSSGEKGGLR